MATTGLQDPSIASSPLLWQSVLAYSFEIYFDFAGYSNMAIGVALMMGMRLPENFRDPYFARSIQDFWRRWHISLSTFFRDNLYIGLFGGNRNGMPRQMLNAIIIMAICGLWHGANTTYIVWGSPAWRRHRGLYPVETHGFSIVALDELGRDICVRYVRLDLVSGPVAARSLDHSTRPLEARVGWRIAASLGLVVLDPLRAVASPRKKAAIPRSGLRTRRFALENYSMGCRHHRLPRLGSPRHAQLHLLPVLVP